MSDILSILRSYRKKGIKGFALLADPDQLQREDYFDALISGLKDIPCDFMLVGGSLLEQTGFNDSIEKLRQSVSLPLVLFPGSPDQLHPAFDAILFLSLVSGRNPEFLIGQHVAAAPRIKALGLETIATAYMLVDGGKPTTASYISNTFPIPWDKPGIAASTAMAAEMLGMQAVYLDTGSGAARAVSGEMISSVHQACSLPIIVGGGIRDIAAAETAYKAGADLVVIGSLFEKEPQRIADFGRQLRQIIA
jgi:putative glycerol-1-phosphate prenyltransferase